MEIINATLANLPDLQTRYRWQINIVSRDWATNTTVFNPALSLVAISCEMNYIEKYLHLSFYQDINADTHQDIIRILESSNTVSVIALNDNNEINFIIEFADVMFTNHSTGFCYSDNNFVTHFITGKFSTVTTRQKDELENSNHNYNYAMKIVSTQK